MTGIGSPRPSGYGSVYTGATSQAYGAGPSSSTAGNASVSASQMPNGALGSDFMSSFTMLFGAILTIFQALLGQSLPASSLLGGTQPTGASIPRFDDTNSLLQCQYAILGDNPAVQQLLATSDNLEPESAEAGQLQAKLTETMQAQGYSPTQIRQVMILQSGIGLNTLKENVMATAANLEPDSLESMQLQGRVAGITQQQQDLAAAFAATQNS